MYPFVFFRKYIVLCHHNLHTKWPNLHSWARNEINPRVLVEIRTEWSYFSQAGLLNSERSSKEIFYCGSVSASTWAAPLCGSVSDNTLAATLCRSESVISSAAPLNGCDCQHVSRATTSISICHLVSRATKRMCLPARQPRHYMYQYQSSRQRRH